MLPTAPDNVPCALLYAFTFYALRPSPRARLAPLREVDTDVAPPSARRRVDAVACYSVATRNFAKAAIQTHRFVVAHKYLESR
jgi:hypothetical protein